MASDSCNKNDLAQRKIALLLWGLPVVLLAVGVFWSEVRVWLWTPALVVAGVACLANAFGCGRLHCYFTGPLFLLGAVATLLRGFENRFFALELDRVRALRWDALRLHPRMGTRQVRAIQLGGPPSPVTPLSNPLTASPPTTCPLPVG